MRKIKDKVVFVCWSAIVAICIVSIAYVAWAEDEARSGEGADEKPGLYWLGMGEDKPSRKSGLASSEGEMVEVLVFINGNPVTFHSGGLLLQQVNQYLKPGSNEISIKRKKKQKLYLRLRLQPDQKRPNEWEQVGSWVIPAEELEFTCDFEADISYKMPIFKENNRIGEDKEAVKEQLRDVLAEWHKLLREHGGTAYVKEVMEGYQIWASTAYGAKPEHTEKVKKSFEKLYSSEEPEWCPLDTRLLKFKFGEQLVLVYQRRDKENEGKAFGFAYEKDGEKKFTYPMLFARIHGDWVAWK